MLVNFIFTRSRYYILLNDFYISSPSSPIFFFSFFLAIIVLGSETRATGAKYQLRAPQPIAKKKYEECRYLDRPMGTLHTRATSTIVLSVFCPIEKLISPTVC